MFALFIVGPSAGKLRTLCFGSPTHDHGGSGMQAVRLSHDFVRLDGECLWTFDTWISNQLVPTTISTYTLGCISDVERVVSIARKSCSWDMRGMIVKSVLSYCLQVLGDAVRMFVSNFIVHFMLPSTDPAMKRFVSLFDHKALAIWVSGGKTHS